MALSWLSLIIYFISSAAPVCAQKLDFLRLSLLGEKVLWDPKHSVPVSVTSDFKTFFFNQTLDHFNYRPESYTTFKQRYLTSSRYWGGANSSAPVFVYLSGEGLIDEDLTGIGFLTDNAAQFEALLVYIEHRYYGESIPLGMSLKEALKDPNARGYFSSSQALADYAAIIIHVKEKLTARDCPVIVLGGSYAGMLASWFGLKYPHVALGALASSAPILYVDGITPQDGYFLVVTKDFKEVSETCYQTIRESWSVIDRVASQPGGLSQLSKIFKTCKVPLEFLELKGVELTSFTDGGDHDYMHILATSFVAQTADELKNYLILQYKVVAQYDDPPRYPVEVICKGIDAANASENGVLEKIFAGIVAWIGDSDCYINAPIGTLPQSLLGWGWQRCSEMVMGIGITNNSMFQPNPFNLSKFIDECDSSYSVVPRPHWITTYYGGHDIEQVLHRVLKNISDTIVAIYIEKGSHCLDIAPAEQADPNWLVRQRKIEVEIIKG